MSEKNLMPGKKEAGRLPMNQYICICLSRFLRLNLGNVENKTQKKTQGKLKKEHGGRTDYSCIG